MYSYVFIVKLLNLTPTIPPSSVLVIIMKYHIAGTLIALVDSDTERNYGEDSEIHFSL